MNDEGERRKAEKQKSEKAGNRETEEAGGRLVPRSAGGMESADGRLKTEDGFDPRGAGKRGTRERDAGREGSRDSHRYQHAPLQRLTSPCRTVKMWS